MLEINSSELHDGATAEKGESMFVAVSAFGKSCSFYSVAMDETGDLHPQDNEQHSYVLVTGANR